MPLIPATKEAEGGPLQAQDQPRLHTKVCPRKEKNKNKNKEDLFSSLAQLSQVGGICHWECTLWTLLLHYPQPLHSSLPSCVFVQSHHAARLMAGSTVVTEAELGALARLQIPSHSQLTRSLEEWPGSKASAPRDT